jgi:hypothetical protein
LFLFKPKGLGFWCVHLGAKIFSCSGNEPVANKPERFTETGRGWRGFILNAFVSRLANPALQ